jgi:predicted small secreted protein
MKFQFMINLLLPLSALVSGCNATRGVGQDIELADETIEELAEDAEDEIDEEGK